MTRSNKPAPCGVFFGEIPRLLQRLLFGNWWCGGVFVFALAAFVVVVSELAGAAYIRLNFASNGNSFHHDYGYVAQSNHAFLYLFVAPLFVGLTRRFLVLAEQGVESLVYRRKVRITYGGALVAEGGASTSEVFDELRLWQPRFRWVLLIGGVLLLLQSAVREWRYFSRDAAQQTKLGFNQACHVDQWVKMFNAGGESHRALMVKGTEIESNIASKSFDIGSVEVARLSGGGKSDTLFWVFLGANLLFEGAFHVFFAWAALRSIGLVILIGLAMCGWGGRVQGMRLRIMPDLDDPEGCFGAASVFEAYTVFSAMLLLGGVMLALTFHSNAPNNTGLGGGDPAAILGYVLMIAVVVLPAVVILVGPLFAFKYSMGKQQRDRVVELDQLIGSSFNGSSDEDLVKKWKEEVARVRMQRTWPAGSKFHFVVLGILYVAVGMSGLAEFFPDQEPWLNAAKSATKWVRDLAAFFHAK